MNVELIAYTPVPEAVCNLAAETCVSKCIPEMDYGEQKSLGHAMASGHESVLEHVSFSFAVEGVSRVTEIQLVRHRIGASYAIQSGRYCTRDPTNYIMPESVTEDIDDLLTQRIVEYNRALRLLDDCMLEMGISAEDRRYFYPQGLKTNIVVTMNARELRHFISLRSCVRAQTEIREVADKMLNLARGVAPKLFEDAGPRCKQMGFCIERRGCGKYPKKI